ncbi:MAG: 50S ribosomal protein L10 [Candidatus Lokiarchaeota archaeon]|nr:50S ribosomal protein L10 [Candidatus Lokiarchaeota archaeon]MBD3341437.1 50S ribosomal protein L10 [Candidatus Lokiarchaeota archaeon]
MISKKHIPQWKIDEVKYLVDLFKEYDNVAIVDVARINDIQIQNMRKLLRDEAIIRMSKKNLLKRAIDQYKKESDKENLDQLAENMTGQSCLVFTNMDMFELKKIFQENLWMVPAKPDVPAPVDIWVLAGDTGLPTGQVISELNMTLKLPTRLQNDTIWVREDTRTHKAGEIVDVKQAAVLKKLGIKPVKSVITINFAWADGEVIPQEVLYMDMEEFQQNIASCYTTARALAIELGILDDETIDPLIQKAYREASALLFEMPIFAENMIDEYVKKAFLNASALNTTILGEGIPSAPKSEPSKKKKKPEKKEEEEEEEPAGIGGLF